MIDESKNFPFELIKWYRRNHRKLPWRDTNDPYKIWLSEIILQQTRVDQGLAYYNRFISKYPKVADLATADQEEVLKDWQGLGYYSRARNLHAAANMIVEDFDGAFPNNYSEIKKLKGVGDYTAAAIASFAYGEAKAVVDGNVYRLLSRYFGIETPIDSTAGKKEFAQLAQELIPKKEAGEYNQAIMEFGALQCKPKNPDCDSCPLQASCSAYANDKVELLPIKARKTKVRNRYFHYLILEVDDQLVLRKREGKGIWQNLFDFPLIESEKLLEWKKLEELVELNSVGIDAKYEFEAESDERKHLLSHQKLHCKFFHLRLSDYNGELKKEFQLCKKNELERYPIPKLIENYLREETNLLSLFNNQS
ncbi:MAG: A/G-specific adenine glycosylase [Flavobacteriales bacterium]|nr:A/G-specific adenine glycosylase [Flavobacteriales bacterium]